MAGIELPEVFQNGMMFQREKIIKIWGNCKEADGLLICFAQDKVSVKVVDGGFYCEMPAKKAAVEQTLSIYIEGEETPEITITHISIGDIFLAAGQSNMEYFLRYDAHWNDGAGSLCADTSFCPFFQMAADQPAGRTDYSLYHFFASHDDFPLVEFFKSMPNEMFEAACIDGCSIYGCFVKIALPLARVEMFVAGIMTFVGNWNELLLAMVFISDSLKKTLPVTLTYFVGPYATNYVQMFAAIIIAIAPTIVVYSIFSNQIIDGLTTGAVKG